MDEILAKAGSQAVTFAIRSGISFASGYAIKTVVRFMEKLPKDQRELIDSLNKEVQTKVSIVSSSIDLVRLAAARGNTILEPTLDLAKSLEREIEQFEQKISSVSHGFSLSNERQSVDLVVLSMNKLVKSIEQTVPLLHLAISTSGIQATGNLPSQVSPGRLLQASTAITEAESRYVLATKKSSPREPVGPIFDVVLYSIFYNPSRLKYVDDTLTSALSWKEDFARANVQIYITSSFSYEIEITEDFNDNRYHEEKSKPRKFVYAILDIARLFFSASGKLLKLEGKSSPVLILKISKDEESWIAFGEPDLFDSDSESDEEEDGDDEEEDSFHDTSQGPKETSLSLLEYIIRLLSLQMNDKKSILKTTDERLALYLRDENYVLNTSYKKGLQEKKNNESLTLDSNLKRLETLKINGKD